MGNFVFHYRIRNRIFLAFCYPTTYNLYIIKTLPMSPRFSKNFSEVIKINIEIKKRSRVKEFFHKLHSTSENLLFKFIIKLPDKFIPPFVMDWLDRYTTKRINQLKQQNIKQTWKNTYLQKAVDEINDRQRV